ncbi:hypothetical protein AV521_00740 [Streptomyces sp. IMTB 2501]|uniref:hypothetical protein n=1 Tax=Streptomyces sp. IMTB 2501 TaxID=1776340 RepID=UPI00096CDBF5|nr:hypothetical protein [Streptomyces sp. IMTB 2501]OLZ74255.1 hypothetical protein AV521_00740 [Streptomyces sp. IMTB 2501]
MTTGAFDSWADDCDHEQARLRAQRPSKAALKREWHRSAVVELEELGELYGVSPEVLKGAR